jgi:demethylmenaquinone methyltransferase/2-methoxy-6-polyprenyl-1,4-benzoquinol methylase
MTRDALLPADENRRLFDGIAPRYDLLNALLSLGLHRAWRRRAVSRLLARDGRDFLDIGCGTGEVSLAILRRAPAARVTGIDLSTPMLERAVAKTRAAGLDARAVYQVGDATALAFGDASFDGIVMAFCLRNVVDHARAFAEMRRVLRPGGTVAILELTRPTGRLPGLVHRLYTHHLVPALGALLSRGSAYRYLASSIDHFPASPAIVEGLTRSGFINARHDPITDGFVTLFSATVPEREGVGNPCQRKAYYFAAPAYANSVPLTRAIPDVAPGSRVVLDHPANLIPPLLDGRIDAGLIPVAGLFANPGLTFIEGTGICARRQVRSVLLKCRRPLDQVRAVLLDPASLSSNALAMVLFRDHWKQPVQFVNEETDNAPADAAVVIGDRALTEPPAAAGDYDLAGQWTLMTGLPFVFAVWALRRDHPGREAIGRIVAAAKDAGKAALPAIIRLEALRLGLSEALCQDYFTRRIHFDVGPREREAMDRFRSLWATLPAKMSCSSSPGVPQGRR